MGIFDNASSVSIGGKEVQSIKLASNNAVLYEKVSDNYLLTLSSNKDILSYYDSESATLTATLTNNNVPISGETVVFSFPYENTYTSKTISANTETTVGRKYVITTSFPENSSSTTYLDSEHKVKIVTKAGDGASLFVNGIQIGSDFSYNFSVEDGIVSWKVSSSSYSYDCSGYDLSVIKSTINLNINDYGGHYRTDTDNNGVATCTYSSQGVGDVTITAECMNLTETYSIEDIYLFRSQEYSHTLEAGGNNLNKLMDETTSLDLPEKFELTFEYKSTGATSSAEHRVYFMPRSLFVANTQPSTAMMVGNIACGNSAHVGVRRDGSKTKNSSQSFSCNTFHTFKITRPYVQSYSTGVFFYYEESYIDYWSLPLAYNYHDWCLCFHMWNAGTVTIRNIKLKAL